MKQWPAGVNSRFAEVTENDILRIEHGNEAANCECIPIIVDTLEEIKRVQTENSSLLFLNVLCCH